MFGCGPSLLLRVNVGYWTNECVYLEKVSSSISHGAEKARKAGQAIGEDMREVAGDVAREGDRGASDARGFVDWMFSGFRRFGRMFKSAGREFNEGVDEFNKEIDRTGEHIKKSGGPSNSRK